MLEDDNKREKNRFYRYLNTRCKERATLLQVLKYVASCRSNAVYISEEHPADNAWYSAVINCIYLKRKFNKRCVTVGVEPLAAAFQRIYIMN